MFGEKDFEYAGNGRTDLHVWHHAAGAVVVNAPASVIVQAGNLCPVVQTISPAPTKLGHYVKALRLHQWLKNVLVLLPVFAAHKVTNIPTGFEAFLAFIAYSLCASSDYFLNDLLDLPADRAQRKRRRPLASGQSLFRTAHFSIPLLLIMAILISVLLPGNFLLVLGAYYLTTFAYSVWLKDKVVIDVVALAGLYTFRIIAGAAATSIMPSFWLLAFSMFLFFSLALVKRYSELLVVLRQNGAGASGRDYKVEDLPILLSLGGSSGFLSVLVMALYVNSSDVRKLYMHPTVLWVVLPILLYWISRIWMKISPRRDA